jgi:hypothetical protein
MRPNALVPNAAAPTPRADLRLAALRLWLSAGIALLLLVPVEAWYHPGIGWLPYWWVMAPAIGLAWLRCSQWLPLAQAWLAPSSLRRAAPRRARRRAAARSRPRVGPRPRPALIRG